MRRALQRSGSTASARVAARVEAFSPWSTVGLASRRRRRQLGSFQYNSATGFPSFHSSLPASLLSKSPVQAKQLRTKSTLHNEPGSALSPKRTDDENSSNDREWKSTNNRYYKEILENFLDIPSMDGEIWDKIEDDYLKKNGCQNSPPPLQALDLLERFQDELSPVVQRLLLGQVVQSGKPKLLERAEQLVQRQTSPDETGQLSEAMRWIVAGWSQVSPRRAVELLQRLTTENLNQEEVLPLYRLVFMACERQGDAELAQEVLNTLLKSHKTTTKNDAAECVFVLDRDIFHRVLSTCARAGMMEATETVFRDMVHYSQQDHTLSCKPTNTTLHWIIQSYVHAGEGQRAFERLLLLSQEETTRPDTFCCNLVMNALAEQGAWQKAERLWDLQQQGKKDDASPFVKAPPDHISLHSLLKAYARANSVKAAERAEKCLAYRPLISLEEKPVVISRSFASVIAIWAKLGKPRRAWALLQELESLYTKVDRTIFQPDPICYTTVLGAFGKSNKINKHEAKQAQDVLEAMYKNMRYIPNRVSYNTVLNCWARAGCPEQAESLLWAICSSSDKKFDGLEPPDIVSYNTVIQAHVKAGNPSRARELLILLLSSAVEGNSYYPKPNTRTFTAVLSALAGQGRPLEAENMLHQMKLLHQEEGWDTRPNLVSYNVVLNAWSQQKDGDRAHKLLKEMAQLDVKPNEVSFNTVIHAHSNNYQRASEVLDEMIACGLAPNKSTRTTLHKILSSDPSVRDKKTQYKILRERVSKMPDVKRRRDND